MPVGAELPALGRNATPWPIGTGPVRPLTAQFSTVKDRPLVTHVDPADVEIIVPTEALRPFVRRYLYANRRLDAPVTVRPKPTGYTYFSNIFGLSGDGSAAAAGETLPRPTRWHAMVDGEEFPFLSRWTFAGQIMDHDIVVRHAEAIEVLFCELAATGLYRLFGVPGARITGKPPTLAELAPQFEPLARAHFVRGAEASREEHVAEANAFFLALAERAGPGDRLVEAAVARFEAANGAVRVADICRELSVSPRHLNRLFRHIVGVPPKFFGQVLQINSVVGLLYFNDAETLTAIAHETGFYDQAHFIHAMQRFFNEGPRDFLRSNHAQLKTFLGASRRFGPMSQSGA
jgi:AraC-like DNA-binding protein